MHGQDQKSEQKDITENFADITENHFALLTMLGRKKDRILATLFV